MPDTLKPRSDFGSFELYIYIYIYVHIYIYIYVYIYIYIYMHGALQDLLRNGALHSHNMSNSYPLESPSLETLNPTWTLNSLLL